MQNQSKQGFTLVEIMIVVVIIGLLAALAIPAFNTVRNTTLEKTIVNDGRLIGTAIQQVAMESGDSQCDVTFTAGTGGAASTWVVTSTNGGSYPGSLSQGVNGTSVTDLDINDGTFVLDHAQYDNSNTKYTAAKTNADGLTFTATGVPTATPVVTP